MGRIGGKWGGNGAAATSCCRRRGPRRKAQVRLRTGEDAHSTAHRAHYADCGVETFDCVYLVEERAQDRNQSL